MHSVAGGTLGARNAELVILRTAWHLRSWYEWASHVERGLAAGLTMGDIERVKAGPDTDGWESPEHLLLQAVDDLQAAHRIREQTLAELDAHFDAPQLLDLVAIHSVYLMLGHVINTWGLELDEHVRKALPDELEPL